MRDSGAARLEGAMILFDHVIVMIEPCGVGFDGPDHGTDFQCVS